VQDGVVALKDVVDGEIATTKTNALGSYTICSLLGNYSIWASKEASASRPEKVSITHTAKGDKGLTKDIVLKR